VLGLGFWFVVFVPMIGGLLAGPLVSRFAPEAREHGVSEMLLAVPQMYARVCAGPLAARLLADDSFEQAVQALAATLASKSRRQERSGFERSDARLGRPLSARALQLSPGTADLNLAKLEPRKPRRALRSPSAVGDFGAAGASARWGADMQGQGTWLVRRDRPRNGAQASALAVLDRSLGPASSRSEPET
jgi:hypothetical protein